MELKRNDSNEEGEQFRNASLYPILICAILLILIGGILTAKHQIASWNFPVRSYSGMDQAQPIVSGPVCMAIGVLMGIFPVYQLVKKARRKKG